MDPRLEQLTENGDHLAAQGAMNSAELLSKRRVLVWNLSGLCGAMHGAA
jgi:hypothetical protein